MSGSFFLGDAVKFEFKPAEASTTQGERVAIVNLACGVIVGIIDVVYRSPILIDKRKAGSVPVLGATTVRSGDCGETAGRPDCVDSLLTPYTRDAKAAYCKERRGLGEKHHCKLGESQVN